MPLIPLSILIVLIQIFIHGLTALGLLCLFILVLICIFEAFGIGLIIASMLSCSSMVKRLAKVYPHCDVTLCFRYGDDLGFLRFLPFLYSI